MACLLLLSFWMISLYTYIRAVAIGVFQISFWGIGPTELRVGLLCCVGGMMVVGPVSVTTPIGDLSPLDTMCALIFTVAFVWYLWMIRSEGRRLAILNPPSDQPVTSG
jgi:hypothetical protein